MAKRKMKEQATKIKLLKQQNRTLTKKVKDLKELLCTRKKPLKGPMKFMYATWRYVLYSYFNCISLGITIK